MQEKTLLVRQASCDRPYATGLMRQTVSKMPWISPGQLTYLDRHVSFGSSTVCTDCLSPIQAFADSSSFR